jgi:hypothetical protein
VARKLRTDTEKGANGSGSDSTPRAGEINPKSKEIETASKPKAKRQATKKKTDGGLGKQIGPKSNPSPMPRYEPSDEEIRIRAYFISERRMQLSLEGDSDHDWLEARRQLVEEGNRAAKEN